MTTTTTLANIPCQWDGVAGAWLSEVTHRTGSSRTPQEYGRYLARFLDLVGDPAQATTAHVHAIAYGPGSSGREPSPATVIVRRQELLGLRAGDLTRNGAVYYNVRTKGGVERRRELPAPAFNAIMEALEAQGRPLDGLAPEDRIFDIAHQTYYAYLRKYARRAGLDGLKPHDLRHTAAR